MRKPDNLVQMPKFRETSVFMRTWGSVVAAAYPERDFAQLKVGQKFVPFCSVELAVLLAGPLGPAAGDERPVGVDDFFGVDGLVSHRGADVCVAGHELGDVRGHAVQHGIGDK